MKDAVCSAADTTRKAETANKAVSAAALTIHSKVGVYRFIGGTTNFLLRRLSVGFSTVGISKTRLT